MTFLFLHRHLKGSLIGSNRKKESMIERGVVPRLVQLMGDDNVDRELRVRQI